MSWSTRQLAELAGTSLRTVRHYHEVGLLEEPERRANGYKSYGVAHLLRVLRVKRLSELGFSLSRIAAMGEAEEYPDQALQHLDAELSETIERLQRARAELALVRRRSAPTDLPPELALAAAKADLTEADRSLLVVMSRLLAPEALESYTAVLSNHAADPADAEFNALPADSDELTRSELTARMVLVANAVIADHPPLRDPAALAPSGRRTTAEVLGAAMDDLYNPAQRDVLWRVGRAVAAGLAEADTPR